MSLPLTDLFPAYLEWLGLRKTLSGRERRQFVCWLLKTRPEVATRFKTEPALLSVMCRDVQRTCSMAPHKGFGQATLKRYAEPLVQKYLAQQPRTRTFAQFLDRVIAECTTEAGLRIFLSNSPSST